jgi:hypothetical protein
MDCDVCVCARSRTCVCVCVCACVRACVDSYLSDYKNILLSYLLCNKHDSQTLTWLVKI